MSTSGRCRSSLDSLFGGDDGLFLLQEPLPDINEGPGPFEQTPERTEAPFRGTPNPSAGIDDQSLVDPTLWVLSSSNISRQSPEEPLWDSVADLLCAHPSPNTIGQAIDADLSQGLLDWSADQMLAIINGVDFGKLDEQQGQQTSQHHPQDPSDWCAAAPPEQCSSLTDEQIQELFEEWFVAEQCDDGPAQACLPNAQTHQLQAHKRTISVHSEPCELAFSGEAGSSPNSNEDWSDGQLCRTHWGKDKDKPWIYSGPTKGKSARATKNATYKPTDFYQPLLEVPAPWSIFKYTKHGELEGRLSFTSGQMEKFLKRNPRRPIIWIQRQPPDSKKRTEQCKSDKCRFQDCPVPNRTIWRGQNRVAFDELTRSNPNSDPQHNAGYAHLWCMERFLDFPSLCRDANVIVEDRELPNEPDGKNKMRFVTNEEVDVANKFVQACRAQGRPPPHYPVDRSSRDAFFGTLNHRIVSKKMKHDANLNRISVDRDSHASIMKHLGDLPLEILLKRQATMIRKGERVRELRLPARFPDNDQALAPNPQKRPRLEDDSDQEIGAPTRAMKRQRSAPNAFAEDDPRGHRPVPVTLHQQRRQNPGGRSVAESFRTQPTGNGTGARRWDEGYRYLPALPAVPAWPGRKNKTSMPGDHNRRG